MRADAARDALARYRQRGRLQGEGSSVRTTPFSRITPRDGPDAPGDGQEPPGASGASQGYVIRSPPRRFDLASEHVRVLLHDCLGERVAVAIMCL